MKDLKIKYNETFGTKRSRDYYRGLSFHFSGKWLVGVHYFSDDYVIDFVTINNCLLACAKSHLSLEENKPTEFIRNNVGDIIGVVSQYWDFVCAGIKGAPSKIRYNQETRYLEYSEDGETWIQIVAIPLVLQETGNSEVDTISQKVITQELNSLDADKMSKSGGTFTGQVSFASAVANFYKGLKAYDTIDANNNKVTNLPAPTSNTDASTKKYVDDSVSGKQDTLVSGTNIKTINNTSLLGSGDLTISSSKDYAQNDPTNGEYIKNRPGGFDVPLSNSAEEVIYEDFSDLGDGYFVVPFSTLNNPGLVEVMKTGISIPVQINFDDMAWTGTPETMYYYRDVNDEIRITNSTSLDSFTNLYIDYANLPNTYVQSGTYYWMRVMLKEEYVPKEVFWCTYSTAGTGTTITDIKDAEAAGKICLVKEGDRVCYRTREDTNYIYFNALQSTYNYYYRINKNSNVWSSGNYALEDSSNKVTSWQSTPSDTKYPSEKLVKDTIDTALGNIETLLAAI